MIVTLQPRLVILTKEGFTEKGIECPDQPVFISVEIPAYKFNRHAKYTYKQTENREDPFRRGQSLWEGGMQCRIADEVRVFTDDPESGLFAAANFQNDPTYPYMFAKLLPCELYDEILGAFIEFYDQL